MFIQNQIKRTLPTPANTADLRQLLDNADIRHQMGLSHASGPGALALGEGLIEDWRRVLKSGCAIDKLKHATAERLRRAIAINLVIAWRIMLMTLLGREAAIPDSVSLHPGYALDLTLARGFNLGSDRKPVQPAPGCWQTGPAR